MDGRFELGKMLMSLSSMLMDYDNELTGEN